MRTIKTEQRTRTVQRCIRAESVRVEETGEEREVRVWKEDGTSVTERRPVTREVRVPAQFTAETVTEDFWIVSDGTDDHTFKSREAAEHFARVLDGEAA